MATTLHRDSWDQYVAIVEKEAADMRAQIERLQAENDMFRCALQDIAVGLGEGVLSQEDMRARAFDALNQQLTPETKP